MTLLDEIIGGAADDSVSTASLLRKVKIVSRRLGADDIEHWVDAELNGYDDEDPLPTYRGPIAAQAIGTYAGPMQSRAKHWLPSVGVPDPDFTEHHFMVRLSQALVELEAFAGSDSDPRRPWSSWAVMKWNEWEGQGKVPHFEMMSLIHADALVSSATVRGIIDVIRNRALDFALDLQVAYPDAGEPGGPTVAEPGVQQVVNHNTNNIYGDGNQIAVGTGNVQTTTVNKGDLLSLLGAARRLGLGDDALAELTAAVVGDDDTDDKRSRLAAFADKVRSGAFVLIGGVTADLAATGVIDLGSQFLG